MRKLTRYLASFGFLAQILASAAAGTALGADRDSAPSSAARAVVTFAIADFDGDRRPDLANIQTGQTSVSTTDYWIQVRLTTADEQYLRIVAPPGGLQVAARDVNGDGAIDLVLTTAWLKEPVAILLNDGHGSFRRLEQESACSGPSESEVAYASDILPVALPADIPSQSRAGACQGTRLTADLIRDFLAALPTSKFLHTPSRQSRLGRAPPAYAS